MTAISTLDSTLPMLDAAGFQKMVYEDFYDVFVGLIRSIGEPDVNGKTLTPEALLEAFQNPEGALFSQGLTLDCYCVEANCGRWLGAVASNYVVVYLRLLTSAQIRYDPESYEPFLFNPETGEQMTTVDFCNSQVEATGKEAGQFFSHSACRTFLNHADICFA